MINWKVRLRNKNFWITIIPALLLLAQVVASIFGQMGETALMVNTELRVDNGDKKSGSIQGNIVMIPDPDALEVLLRKLKVL